MRVAVQKVPGVESVEVSLEKAAVDVTLRSGNGVTLPQLRQIVKNNGFTAREARVIVVGDVIERDGKPALHVTGPDIVLPIAPDPKQPDVYEQVRDRLRTARGRALELRGVVEPRTDEKEADRLVVSGVRAAPG